MDNWMIGLFLKPFVALFFFVIAALLARAITSRMKDGKLKRLLLRRVGP
jgi:hypothetical protein